MLAWPDSRFVLSARTVCLNSRFTFTYDAHLKKFFIPSCKREDCSIFIPTKLYSSGVRFAAYVYALHWFFASKLKFDMFPNQNNGVSLVFAPRTLRSIFLEWDLTPIPMSPMFGFCFGFYRNVQLNVQFILRAFSLPCSAVKERFLSPLSPFECRYEIMNIFSASQNDSSAVESEVRFALLGRL